MSWGAGHGAMGDPEVIGAEFCGTTFCGMGWSGAEYCGAEYCTGRYCDDSVGVEVTATGLSAYREAVDPAEWRGEWVGLWATGGAGAQGSTPPLPWGGAVPEMGSMRAGPVDPWAMSSPERVNCDDVM